MIPPGQSNGGVGRRASPEPRAAAAPADAPAWVFREQAVYDTDWTLPAPTPTNPNLSVHWTAKYSPAGNATSNWCFNFKDQNAGAL